MTVSVALLGSGSAAWCQSSDGSIVPPGNAGPPAAELTPAASDAESESRPGTPPFIVAGGFLEQFNASLDNGGRYGASRYHLAASARFELAPTLELRVGTAAVYSDYRFTGGDSFSSAPWDDVLAVSLLPRLTWMVDEQWAITVGPAVEFTGESDAKFSDSLQWGGLAAVSYAFSKDLRAGLGLLVITQLEDDPLFLPIPLIDWHLGDEWRISNVRGPEANPFAGIEAIKSFDRQWEVAVGAAYVTRRFRLNDKGPAPEGVGSDSGVPLFARLSFRPTPVIRLDLLAGVSVLNRLTLDDSGGHRITATDADPAPLLGIFGSIRF